MNTTKRLPPAFLGIAGILACEIMVILLGRSAESVSVPEPVSSQQADSFTTSTSEPVDHFKPVHLEIQEIENLWLIGRRSGANGQRALYSGASPDSREAFARLKDLGVETIISVDGATPDFETAGEFGMTYVHAPIPYRGIDEEVSRELGQFVRNRQGTVYVHCHHGKHRGPAAAAICSMALGILNPQDAREFLEHVGTDPNYSGLWRDVAAFVPDSAETRPGEYQHLQIGRAAKIESLASSMVRIDHLFEEISRKISAGALNADSMTAECTSDALLLAEEFTEGGRQLETDGAHAEEPNAADLLNLMKRSADDAMALHTALKSAQVDLIKPLLSQMKANCTACHQKYRDR